MDLLASGKRPPSTGSRPMPHDFLRFLSYACNQLEAPFEVKINVEKQGDYHRVDEKIKKPRRNDRSHQSTKRSSQPSDDMEEQEFEISSPIIISMDVQEIVLTAVMDSSGHLVEIIFNRCVAIPCLLIKVIGLCIPYQNHLHRLTVRWGPLTTLGLYEFSKFLSNNSSLSEICLDDSPVAGRNYEVLLEQPSRLHYLSLARCKLDDADCAKLVALLTHPRPAAKTLHILILVSNRIGDEGAYAFANLLRNNRGLHCLNLAGNHITDLGAISIFKSLMEFPLTNDELIAKRSRHFEYLRLRKEVYARCLKELNQDLRKSQDEVRLTRRRTIMRAHRKMSTALGMSTANAIYQRADAMTTELIGVFFDPFSKDKTLLRAGQLYCIGNMALCCLNLSYNSLEYTSLAPLFETLTHQSWLGSRAATGLLHVSIEGNNLPVDCDQLFLIEDLLEKAQAAKGRHAKRSLDKARPSRMITIPVK